MGSISADCRACDLRNSPANVCLNYEHHCGKNLFYVRKKCHFSAPSQNFLVSIQCRMILLVFFVYHAEIFVINQNMWCFVGATQVMYSVTSEMLMPLFCDINIMAHLGGVKNSYQSLLSFSSTEKQKLCRALR